MQPGLPVLKSRLAAFVRPWPGAMTTAFRRRIDARSPRRPKRRSTGSVQGPIWQELPRWLFEKYDPGSRGNARRRRTLEDLLWAQYCLFLVIRLRDDLFDGQARDPLLLFAADQFLIESQRVFDEDLGAGPAFWRIYRQRFQDTILAILEVDHHQRSRRRGCGGLLDAYSRQASIFKIAPAWLCLRFDRRKDHPRISRFMDAVTAADQILDDLSDIEEDRRSGRLNFAARWLEGRSGRPRRGDLEPPPGRAAAGAPAGDGLSGLLSMIRWRLDDASAAISRLKIPQAELFLHDYRHSLDRFQTAIHRRRVRLLFGELLAHR